MTSFSRKPKTHHLRLCCISNPDAQSFQLMWILGLAIYRNVGKLNNFKQCSKTQIHPFKHLQDYVCENYNRNQYFGHQYLVIGGDVIKTQLCVLYYTEYSPFLAGQLAKYVMRYIGIRYICIIPSLRTSSFTFLVYKTFTRANFELINGLSSFHEMDGYKI